MRMSRASSHWRDEVKENGYGYPARPPRSALHAPLAFGPFTLKHRVVMGPMTRCRAYNGIPQPHAVHYYSQRATEGGMLISEAAAISPTADGYMHAPGIWTQEQVEAWKPIVQGVHKKGGIFFCQLSHVGRRSHTSFQPNGAQPFSSTSRPITNDLIATANGTTESFSVPRALETDEIRNVIADYASAARNAIAAGFDGIELHAANGYLLDQFLKDGINDRTDAYGGPIENRARLLLEVVEAVANAIGSDRVGVKLSPHADFGEGSDSEPIALGVYIAHQLTRLKVLYATFVEARIQSAGLDLRRQESVWPFRRAFGGIFLAGGGYNREGGIAAIESGKAEAVLFAHLFLANPDLPRRFELNAPLNDPDFETLFSQDPVKGYTDYPALDTGYSALDENNRSRGCRRGAHLAFVSVRDLQCGWGGPLTC